MREVKKFIRKYLITLQLILLTILIVADWTNLLRYSGGLLCGDVIVKWYRILFYAPLVLSIQLQMLEIDVLKKTILTYFGILLAISLAEFFTEISECLGFNVNVYCAAQSLALKFFIVLLVSAVIYGLWAQIENRFDSRTENFKKRKKILKSIFH